jgi:hypothetical protein
LTASITSVQSLNPFSDTVQTFSGTAAGSSFGSAINTTSGRGMDQPWMRTGASNHVYTAVNDLSNSNGKTASVLVSTNGGSTYNEVILDRVGGSASGGFAQDAPAVRLAVNGSTVYSVFSRWTSVVSSDSGGTRLASQLVVVRSDNGGADGFTALGSGGNGIQVATPTTDFANTENTALTLGQERTASDLAIAVDPNNASHVVVAYDSVGSTSGSGVRQLVVAESTDGGATWSQKFTTASSTRSGQPGLAILANGGIGLLYDNYDPNSNMLSQHLLTTTNDFATTSDTTLGTETNSTPTSQFDPYLGDFFDLSAIGNTFYGIFSASNADDGTNAQFSNVSFLRNFSGTPGTSGFHLTDSMGNTIASSIDPFFFSYSLLTTVAWASGTSGDFAVAANWTPAGVPGSSNDVQISPSGTYTVTSTANETVNSLTTAAGATLLISAGTFTINNGTDSGANAGTIIVGAGSTLVLNGSVTNPGLIEALGGSITINGGPVTGSGLFKVGLGGSVNATGNNYVFHGAGGSELMLGTGNLNQAFSDSGSALLYFTGNQNQLFGGSMSDWLGVSGNNNALVGGAGNDFIGATGNSDTLAGGSGNQTLFANGDSNYLAAGSGQDWLGASGNLTQIFGGPGNDWMGITGGHNAISAGSGNSTLFAVGSANTLFGSTGNDWLGVSGNGNYLAGGSGNDYIAATGSVNTLDPHGAGTDVLFAATNNHDHDQFVYHPGYGNVTINNFVPQVGDVINIAGFGITNVQGFAPYVSTSADGSIVLNLSSASHLTLEGIPGGLQNSWFNFHA